MDPNHAEEQFRRGVSQFNSRAFFQAHETWEEIWLQAPEPDKTFLQGIIQVAAAFHHCVRGNRAGAGLLLRAGLGKLEAFSEHYRGLRVAELRAAAQRWMEALAAGDDLPLSELPPIEFAAER